MEQQIIAGHRKNSIGYQVPIELIKEIDLLRDDLVIELSAKAEALEKQIAEFKKTAMETIKAFVELSAEKYGVSHGGAKGNISLISFDGSLKILLSVQEHITFDERLHAAKILIDECLTEWSTGAHAELKAIVTSAFDVDKIGKINIRNVLGLRRLEIKHPKWLEAMSAISDSIQTAGSKEYVRLYRRDYLGNFSLFNLDIASAITEVQQDNLKPAV